MATKHPCRPIHTKAKWMKKGPARHQRIVTIGSIGISRRRREDWLILRAAKQMGEKSKETKVAAKSRRYHQERCVGSSWILIIKGGIFSAIRRFIYPTNLRNELNTSYTTSNYNRLTHVGLIETLNKKIARFLSCIIGSI